MKKAALPQAGVKRSEHSNRRERERERGFEWGGSSKRRREKRGFKWWEAAEERGVR